MPISQQPFAAPWTAIGAIGFCARQVPQLWSSLAGQARRRKAPMTTEAPTWEALLLAANAGDARAFARFLVVVTPILRGIVRSRGDFLPPDQHEDVVQEVLLTIHLKRHTWRSDSPVRPWLYAITRHKVTDAFRRRGKSVTLPIEDFLDVIETDGAPDPTAAHDTERLLAQIDRRSAEIVRAISLTGESSDEVARRLAMTDGAVRVVLHRAMRRLADFARGGPT
jgi:RNA polymerase sigma factor (sigma-70 family)